MTFEFKVRRGVRPRAPFPRPMPTYELMIKKFGSLHSLKSLYFKLVIVQFNTGRLLGLYRLI